MMSLDEYSCFVSWIQDFPSSISTFDDQCFIKIIIHIDFSLQLYFISWEKAKVNKGLKYKIIHTITVSEQKLMGVYPLFNLRQIGSSYLTS